MDTNFEQKMKGICERTVKKITDVFKDDAVEAHVFGSMATGTNDALSDIDIWLTFDDSVIASVIENRMNYYSQIGEILFNHEMQNNIETVLWVQTHKYQQPISNRPTLIDQTEEETQQPDEESTGTVASDAGRARLRSDNRAANDRSLAGHVAVHVVDSGDYGQLNSAVAGPQGPATARELVGQAWLSSACMRAESLPTVRVAR